MMMSQENGTESIVIINEFPEKIGSSFNHDSYINQFNGCSFIIHAHGSNVSYPSHWGVLSIKSAFKGTEFYKSGNSFFAVNDSNFLVFNEGTYRSSHISSTQQVESFSVSFSPSIVRSFMATLLNSGDRIIDDPYYSGSDPFEFTEKLYPHDQLVSPLLLQLKRLSESSSHLNEMEETLSYLLGSLFVNQKQVWGQMDKIQSVKVSTRKELYHRLNRARDYIFSCFKENLTIESIANVACLNQHYFLREFKKVFNYTPHQYLQNVRLNEAKLLLETTDKLVTEVCNEVGYNDLASFSKLYKKHFTYAPTKNRAINAA
jgi:AraC-like DNA-binding protein